jgi:hypothetical protein
VDGPLLNLDDQATFAVLSDVGNKVARQFGIVFQIGKKCKSFTTSGAQSSDARLGRCGRACGHEALGAAREHVASTDRPGGMAIP